MKIKGHRASIYGNWEISDEAIGNSLGKSSES